MTILTSNQCPLDGGGNTPKNCIDMLVTGEICESAFHNLDGADSNFRSFSAATAGCYEFEVQQREFMLAAVASTAKETSNEFVGVSSLDILQGVGRGMHKCKTLNF